MRSVVLAIAAVVGLAPAADAAPVATERVVVRVEQGADPTAIGDVVRAVSDDTFVLDVAARSTPVARSDVVWAQPEVRYRAALVPDDPCFTSCGIHLGGQRNLRTVRAQEAWDVTTGSAAVVVAVVDTPVDDRHPELVGKVRAGPDLRGAPCTVGDPLLTGHGTAVAALIAARTDDGVGMASLGWNTTVLSVPVLDDCGWADASSVAAGIRAAVDGGARIINLSIAGPAHRAVEDAVVEAHRRGVLVIAAAGNDPRTVAHPAAYPSVIAVGATDADGERLAPWSGRGPAVDLVAPGDDVLSAAPALGGYWIWQGTSFAAPLVSAAVALCLSVHPHFDADDAAYSLVHASRPSLDRPPLLDASAMVRHDAGGLVLLGADGGVLTYGDAAFHGALAGLRLNAPVTGIAAHDHGYWIAAADGGVFAFGVPFLGSAGALPLRAPVVDIATTPTGAGYWLAAADGGVFTFGDAPFAGSAVGRIAAPVVGIAGTPSGRGYLLVTAGGDVHAFGDARWAGDGRPDTVAVVTAGSGYHLVDRHGHVEPRGGAPVIGDPSRLAPSPVVDIAPSPGGAGYWVVTADGRPLAAGRALDDGQVRPAPTAPIVAAASTG